MKIYSIIIALLTSAANQATACAVTNKMNPDELATLFTHLSIAEQNNIKLVSHNHNNFFHTMSEGPKKALDCPDDDINQLLSCTYNVQENGNATPLTNRTRLLLFKAIKENKLPVIKKLMNLFLLGEISFYCHNGRQICTFDKKNKKVMKKLAFFKEVNATKHSTLYTGPLQALFEHMRDKKYNDSILHACVRSHAPEILEYFLDIFTKNKVNLTSSPQLLEYTTTNDYQGAEFFLKETGLHPDGIVNRDNMTFITLAYKLYDNKKKHPILSLIKRFLPNMKTALHRAAEKEYVKTMRVLLHYKAATDACSSNGETIDELTSSNDNKKVRKLLIKNTLMPWIEKHLANIKKQRAGS